MFATLARAVSGPRRLALLVGVCLVVGGIAALGASSLVRPHGTAATNNGPSAPAIAGTSGGAVPPGRRGRHATGTGGRRLAPLLTGYLAAAAQALGLAPADLRADLARGMTLQQVARDRNVSEDQFRRAVVAAVTPELDQAVRAGRLTAAQEQRILQRLQSGAPPGWAGRFRGAPIP